MTGLWPMISPNFAQFGTRNSEINPAKEINQPSSDFWKKTPAKNILGLLPTVL